jgi:hypothetical protein
MDKPDCITWSQDTTKTVVGKHNHNGNGDNVPDFYLFFLPLNAGSS